jgi:uncharacterized repeat protein (TIGR02543 family)
MMDLYNVNFEYSSALAKLNEIAGIYRPLMTHYFERWGYPGQNEWDSGWTSVFQNKVDDAKRYLNEIRNAMTNVYLPRHFSNLGSLVNVTLSANIASASIKINTTTPNLAGKSWIGKYYTGYPITVTANVPTGYTFTGWTVTGGNAVSPSVLTTTVNFSGNVQITANYSR